MPEGTFSSSGVVIAASRLAKSSGFMELFSLVYCLHWLLSVSLRLKAQRVIRVSFGVYFAALCLAYSSGVNLPPFT